MVLLCQVTGVSGVPNCAGVKESAPAGDITGVSRAELASTGSLLKREKSSEVDTTGVFGLGDSIEDVLKE